MGWLPEGVAATPLGGGGGSQAIPKKNWGGSQATLSGITPFPFFSSFFFKLRVFRLFFKLSEGI